MGIWGTGLYDNDAACGVRDIYIDYIQDGLSNDEAYKKTLEECHDYLDDQDEPLLWFALAETQWKMGRLRPDVKMKALELIKNNGYLDLWKKSPKGATDWKETLQKLGEMLAQPMPKEKRIPSVNRNPWNLYDVYAYMFHKEESKENGFLNKYMLIQKIGEKRYGERKRLYMQIQVADHVFDELPELEDINRYRILPLDDLMYNINRRKFRMNGFIDIGKQSEYPKKHLTFLGIVSGPANKIFSDSSNGLSWLSLEYFLSHYYQFWKVREYKTVEEGIYSYINK